MIWTMPLKHPETIDEIVEELEKWFAKGAPRPGSEAYIWYEKGRARFNSLIEALRRHAK
jgi:hypothetical protein